MAGPRQLKDAFSVVNARVRLGGTATRSRRLNDLVRWAVASSPFYADLYQGLRLDAAVPLEQLPVVTKAQLMSNMDRVFTDRRLTLEAIDRYVAGETPSGLHLGRYHVLSTSGSTGLPAVFVFDRREWSAVVASYWRWIAMVGLTPRPWRRRIAIIGAPTPLHASRLMADTIDIGMYRILYCNATTSTRQLVQALDRFQPQFLLGYPSACALLALEQLDGRLRIRPRVVATGGDMLTSELKSQIRQAWGVGPHDFYSLTEAGLVAGQCREQAGHHLFDDQVIFEVVDEHNRAVNAGTPGAKVLVTNLFLRTQPLIRYEVTDIVTVATDGCRCGRRWPLIAIDGRTDDLLRFHDAQGSAVAVHPAKMHTLIEHERDVRQYQIVQEGQTLRLVLVLAPGAVEAAVTARLCAAVHSDLESLELTPPRIEVRCVESISREDTPGGKLKRVISLPPPADSSSPRHE